MPQPLTTPFAGLTYLLPPDTTNIDSPTYSTASLSPGTSPGLYV